ncbi:MAG: 50S ribosomal protein L16 [Chloroflexi bacterium]|nr:50S ribosomal protein L16 [Chloroflexota bacterium]
MLQPKRVKFRKVMRGHRRGIATAGTVIQQGDWALKALETGWISSRQIEAARRAIVRSLRRGGKVWIRIYPDKPVTAKPLETRMGSGKGNVESWVAVVKRGRIMFEIAGVGDEVARESLRLAAMKMSVATKIVGRADFLMARASSSEASAVR